MTTILSEATPSLCPYCQKGSIVTSYSPSEELEVVCSSCGIVVDEIIASEQVEPTPDKKAVARQKREYEQFMVRRNLEIPPSLGSDVGNPQDRRRFAEKARKEIIPKRLTKWIHVGHDRNVKIFKHIDGYAIEIIGLNTSPALRQRARDIYKEMQKAGLVRGRVSIIMAVASLYRASRESNHGLTLKDFASATNFEKCDIQKYHRLIVSKLTPISVNPKKELVMPRNQGSKKSGGFMTEGDIRKCQARERPNKKSLSKLYSKLDKAIPTIINQLKVVLYSPHTAPWLARHREQITDIWELMDRIPQIQFSRMFEYKINYSGRGQERVYWLDLTTRNPDTNWELFDTEYALSNFRRSKREAARLKPLLKAGVIPWSEQGALTLDAMENNLAIGKILPTATAEDHLNTYPELKESLEKQVASVKIKHLESV